jgi:hypothetical protein
MQDVRQIASANSAIGRRLKAACRGAIVVLLLGCSDEEGATAPQPATGGTSNEGRRCSPAEGTSGNPKTIREALDLINGLPQPVDFPCFLESLDRPLSINATSNTQSAQPARGKRSPRIFIVLNESLSMSFVPAVVASTLEFGERKADDPGFSVKAEVHFPIEDQLVPEDAFSRLAPDPSTGRTLEQATLCGVCHDNEKPTPDYPILGAFASAIVRPTPFFAVDAATLRKEVDTCDAATEPERCAMLHALFGHGNVVQTAFP